MIACTAPTAPKRAVPFSRDKRLAFQAAYRPFIDRAALRGAAAVTQMAEDFLMFIANAGAIVRDDLELLGWTPRQIDRHGADARRAANRSAEG